MARVSEDVFCCCCASTAAVRGGAALPSRPLPPSDTQLRHAGNGHHPVQPVLPIRLPPVQRPRETQRPGELRAPVQHSGPAHSPVPRTPSLHGTTSILPAVAHLPTFPSLGGCAAPSTSASPTTRLLALFGCPLSAMASAGATLPHDCHACSRRSWHCVHLDNPPNSHFMTLC